MLNTGLDLCWSQPLRAVGSSCRGSRCWRRLFCCSLSYDQVPRSLVIHFVVVFSASYGVLRRYNSVLQHCCRCQLDDPLDAVAVHAGGGLQSTSPFLQYWRKKDTSSLTPGLWGLLCVPFFMSANLEVGMRGILFDGEAFFLVTLAISHNLGYYLLKILFDTEAFFGQLWQSRKSLIITC